MQVYSQEQDTSDLTTTPPGKADLEKRKMSTPHETRNRTIAILTFSCCVLTSCVCTSICIPNQSQAYENHNVFFAWLSSLLKLIKTKIMTMEHTQVSGGELTLLSKHGSCGLYTVVWKWHVSLDRCTMSLLLQLLLLLLL